jgi:DNA polymerase III subunit alpha
MRAMSLPTMCTTSTERRTLQDILLAIQTGALITDPNRFAMTVRLITCVTRRNGQPVRRNARSTAAIRSLIADRCTVDLSTKGYHLPRFPVPMGYTAETYLRELCEEGLRRRYGETRVHESVVASGWNMN